MGASTAAHLQVVSPLDGPQQAEKFVADRIKEGADHRKIMLADGTLTGPAIAVLGNATISALTSEARERGMWSTDRTVAA